VFFDMWLTTKDVHFVLDMGPVLSMEGESFCEVGFFRKPV